MSVLVIPASVRPSLRCVEECGATISVQRMLRIAASYLMGTVSEEDIKQYAKKVNVAYQTLSEAIDALCFVLCEAVRCRCTVRQFREFIAELEYLNTPEVLEVYAEMIDGVREALNRSAHSTDHFVSLDWRVEIEFARRSLRSFRRPKATLDLKTDKKELIFETPPASLVQLYQTLDAALQTCRSSKFRRIQRFVK